MKEPNMSFEQDNQDPSMAASQNGEAGTGDPSVGFNDGSGGESSEYVVPEEKKSAMSRSTLIMFGVLALGAAGVWVMYQRVGPGKAVAAPSAESVQAKKTINAFLDGGGTNIKSMETMLRSTEKVVQQFLTYPSMTQVPLSDLRTNPFRLRAAHPTSEPSDDATERRKREEERVAMLKSVQALRLQSIMYSDARKACMINDTMYREGDKVDAFTVEKVTANSVVVKGGVYRFELRMQR
jgi:hypothetical protein